jgi:hypothetical protein
MTGRMFISFAITGLVPVISIREATRFSSSPWPGLIPGSSPGTAIAAVGVIFYS